MTQSANSQGIVTDLRAWRAGRMEGQKRQDQVNQQILRRLHGLSSTLN